MNRKQFLILLVLVIVLGGAGLVIYRGQNNAQSAGNTAIGKKLFSNFPLNDIAGLTIKQGTNEVSLIKRDDLWRVHERGDYPANFTEISGFLIQLRDLKAVDSEHVGPSQLPRLHLGPAGQGTDSPTVVEFKDQSGKTISTLLLGKMQMNSKGASQGGVDEAWPKGRYVKTGAESDLVAVISAPLENIVPNPEQWLNKDFLHIEKPRSIEVIFPTATNSWKLTREGEAGEWALADARPGEELDASKASGVAGTFGSLAFTDVKQGALSAGGTNRPTLINIETFDNFHYAIQVGERVDDNFPLSVSVTAQLAKERSPTPGKDEKPEEKARLDKEFKDKQQKLEDKLKLEQGFGKWTYLVSNWAIDPALKERSGLMKDKAAPDTAGKSGEPRIEDPPLPATSFPPQN